MACVLALDISQRCTGFAFDGRDPGVPKTGTFRAPKPAGDSESGFGYGLTLSRYHEWLDAMLVMVRPKLIAFEAPLNVVGMRHSNRPTSQATVRILFNLAGVTEMTAYDHGIECVETNISTVKKHFAGHGRADKDAIMARCHQLGWAVENEDAADAAAVWSYNKAIRDPAWAPRSTPLFGRKMG